MLLSLFTVKEFDCSLRRVCRDRSCARGRGETKEGMGWKEALFGKGKFIRFAIAAALFLLQQWSGQNLAGYYAPRIIASVCLLYLLHPLSPVTYLTLSAPRSATSATPTTSLPAVSTALSSSPPPPSSASVLKPSVVEILPHLCHRHRDVFYIVGAIPKTHPPPAKTSTTKAPANLNPAPTSKVMTVMLHIYVCFYSIG
jgi:hypothetical protein